MGPIKNKADITQVIGRIPYRMAFAGGWIDQPFISCHNPTPPGSMVVVAMDAQALGKSMAACMHCWEAILPNTVRHPSIQINLMSILTHYQERYFCAMYSGCGGGYLYVVADEPVPGGFQVRVRTA
jgi:hypothetical protein